MKRIVSLLLVFLFLAGSVASAEAFDFTAMTTDQLLALREQLNAEINTRIGDDMNLIGDGIYVVGKDIKPGMYRITCAAAFGNGEFFVNLFDSLENYHTYDQSRWQNASYRLFQALLYEGGMCTVNLTDGMAVEIYKGIGRIEAIQPDWTP